VTTPADATSKKLADAQAALEAAQAEHDAAQESAPPRAPGVVLADLLDELAMRTGHHPHFVKLVAEFKATLPKEEPAPEEQPLK
jgi:hypothetical protein